MTAPSATALRLIALLAAGHTRASAAAEVGLSYESAKWHLKDAYAKLGARNASHAVALAIRSGLVRL